MPTATQERRRNMRPENCRACGKFVQAGEGWLYRDTNGASARRAYQRTGRFGWFVKCDGCHGSNESKTTLAMKREAEARGPVALVRPWSVRQVAKWTVERGEDEGDVCLWLVGPFGRAKVGYRDRITSRFTGMGEYQLEQETFGTAGLSPAAAALLAPKVQEAFHAIAAAEQAAGEVAAERLRAVGASVEQNPYGQAGWKVTKEGLACHFYLYGNADGGAVLHQHGAPVNRSDLTLDEVLEMIG